MVMITVTIVDNNKKYPNHTFINHIDYNNDDDDTGLVKANKHNLNWPYNKANNYLCHKYSQYICENYNNNI